MIHTPLKERARGRWPGILAVIGVPSKTLRNVHGPCPMPGCGGKDRFRFDNRDGRGTWICNRCGAGDGIDLVERFLGVGFKEAARMIEQHLRAASAVIPSDVPDKRKRQIMVDLWDGAKPIADHDPAGRYLTRQLGIVEMPPPSCLRFTTARCYELGMNSVLPTMVALIEPCDDPKPKDDKCALHRTYLDHAGNKAHVTSPRKMLGAMPSGAAVRLMPHNGVLGIAEGIETALAASVLHNVPVWAALNAGLLEKWMPPASVRAVVIFADNDPNFVGQNAAYTLAGRLKALGFEVEVRMPAETGSDWADVLAARR